MGVPLRILFLTQIVPYPPDSGPKVKTYHVLRYLSEQGHKIHLASFVRKEEETNLESLRSLCEEVYSVPIQRSRVADGFYWLRSHITGRPFLIERDDLSGMRNLIRDILNNKAIDCIHADQLTMAQFGLPPVSLFGGRSVSDTQGDRLESDKQPLLVFDAHNAVWTIVDRMRQTVPTLLRPILNLEVRRVKRYEGMIVTKFDHTFAVTDIDKNDLLNAQRFASAGVSYSDVNSSISVIPIAVDTGSLQPVDRIVGSRNILTLGTLHYPPNADGIRWFFSEVFPLI